MLRVRPGVELVRANLVPTKELITLDLPTLERPRNAISGTVGAGKCAASVAAARNRDKTLMLKFATTGWKLASIEDNPCPAQSGFGTIARRPSFGHLFSKGDCNADLSDWRISSEAISRRQGQASDQRFCGLCAGQR